MGHSAEDYTLGKGIGYFGLNDVNGNAGGERDLGNIPNLSLSISLDFLEHYSSRAGIKKKDKQILREALATFTFTLENMTRENVEVFLVATTDTIIQTGADDETDAILLSKKDRYFPLSKRKIGSWKVQYKDTLADNVIFVVGEVVSGATGVGTVTKVLGNATEGYLFLSNVTPGFVLDEAITGDGTGAAECAAVEVFDTTDLVVTSDSGSTIYIKGTDYTVDSVVGRVFITATSTIADDTILSVDFGCSAVTYYKTKTLKNTEFEGSFRFVGNNPAGNNREFFCPRVSLAPEGDFELISDESLQNFTVNAEVLANTVNEVEEFMDVVDGLI